MIKNWNAYVNALKIDIWWRMKCYSKIKRKQSICIFCYRVLWELKKRLLRLLKTFGLLKLIHGKQNKFSKKFNSKYHWLRTVKLWERKRFWADYWIQLELFQLKMEPTFLWSIEETSTNNSQKKIKKNF